MRTGPFRILVMSSALEFPHDSIPTCLTMLQDLGKATAPERAKIAGLAADTTWTVDQMVRTILLQANYFSEVTADNLKNYEMFYSNNPTGPVFTNAPSGAQKKQIFVDYWNNGGAWAGQHSATDFENNNKWTWFQDNIDGGWFVDHDNPTDARHGDLANGPGQPSHPQGIAEPLEHQRRVVRHEPQHRGGSRFQDSRQSHGEQFVEGNAPRPAVWVTENANAKGGRAFYTIQGHSQSTYTERSSGSSCCAGSSGRFTACPAATSARAGLASPAASGARCRVCRRLFRRRCPFVLQLLPIRRPTFNGEIIE